MKRNLAIIIALALVAVVGSIYAQSSTYTLKGRVTWNSGPNSSKGVDGATVTLAPGNYTATTSADGSYQISGVPSGTYTAHVKSAKYNSSVTKVVILKADKTMDLRLRWHKLAVRKRNGGVGIEKRNSVSK